MHLSEHCVRLVSQVRVIVYASLKGVQHIHRCTGKPDDLDGPSLPRTKEYTELLIKYLDLKTLWQDYGVAGEAEVCFLGLPLLTFS